MTRLFPTAKRLLPPGIRKVAQRARNKMRRPAHGIDERQLFIKKLSPSGYYHTDRFYAFRAGLALRLGHILVALFTIAGNDVAETWLRGHYCHA